MGTKVIGQVIVAASNVSLRDFAVEAVSANLTDRTILVNVSKNVHDVTITRFSVDGKDAKLAQGVGGTSGSENINVSGGDVYGCGYDGLRTFSNSTYSYMYVHDLWKWNAAKDGQYTPSLPHNEAPHTDGVQVSSSGNIIENSWIVNSAAENATSAIFVSPNEGKISSLIVRNNYLGGGSYTVHVHTQNADLNNPGPNDFPTGLIFENNTFFAASNSRVWSNYDVPSTNIRAVDNSMASGVDAPSPTPVALSGPATIIGSGGNDDYYVSHAEDTVVELPSGGYDRIFTKVSYKLQTGQAIEELRLSSTTGSRAANLWGNEFSNSLFGNDGDNRLDGGTGADTLTGKAGDDTYIVDNVGDVVRENSGGGIDNVRSKIDYSLTSNVENLFLFGQRDIFAIGNVLPNAIIGNSGDNVVIGNGGADKLSGAGGNDIFKYLLLSDSSIATADWILDFSAGDKIDLSSIDANTKKLGNQDFFAVGSFTGTRGELILSYADGETSLTIDVNLDRKADFQIHILGHVDVADQIFF